MTKTLDLPTCADITTGNLDSNASEANGLYPFFTCAPTPTRINHYEFDCDAILLAGNNAAGNFHLNKYKGKFNAYQRTYVITAKKGFDLNYLFYSLKMDLMRFKRIAQGSQTKFLTMRILDSFKIVERSLDEQENLIKLLSFLDSKINLNNKVNSELEEMAKTLYNYWFVQYDFPNENGKPYKTSGGVMEYNEVMKREIPIGWEGLFLNEWLTFERGIEPLSVNYFDTKESDEHIPFYKVGDMDGEVSTWVLKEIADSSIATEEDILFSFDGTVGKIAIGLNGAFSTGIRKIYQKKGYFPKSYIYFVFQSEEIQKTIKQKAQAGANIIHASSSIDYLTVPYNEKIVRLYNQQTDNIFNKLLQNKKQNHELTHLRDFLLPLLMNGQVKVN